MPVNEQAVEPLHIYWVKRDYKMIKFDPLPPYILHACSTIIMMEKHSRLSFDYVHDEIGKDLTVSLYQTLDFYSESFGGEEWRGDLQRRLFVLYDFKELLNESYDDLVRDMEYSDRNE